MFSRCTNLFPLWVTWIRARAWSQAHSLHRLPRIAIATAANDPLNRSPAAAARALLAGSSLRPSSWVSLSAAARPLAAWHCTWRRSTDPPPVRRVTRRTRRVAARTAPTWRFSSRSTTRLAPRSTLAEEIAGALHRGVPSASKRSRVSPLRVRNVSARKLRVVLCTVCFRASTVPALHASSAPTRSVDKPCLRASQSQNSSYPGHD